MGKGSEHGHYTSIKKVGKQCGIDLIHIAHVTVIYVFNRTFYGTDNVHIDSGKPQSIDTAGLQTGYDIFIDQPAINHRNYFQHFGIGNTPAVHHFTLNTK